MGLGWASASRSIRVPRYRRIEVSKHRACRFPLARPAR
ncbi:hypothetical protein BURPS1710A_A0212 [Burkholderia pseudomallei 1710a]|uniref:Uncharacterized protein n=1 Tax=Burkholderia pseudomallei 1710a TaxID=320371 RepID=A0A0E1VWG2_BURPE|nr:hypothetical protein BURPS1710A_A0212 [Burkholderia pseudomallei 1710a]